MSIDEEDIPLLCELCLDSPESISLLEYDTTSRDTQTRVWVCEECGGMVRDMTCGVKGGRRFGTVFRDALKKNDRHRASTLHVLMMICNHERRKL